MPVIQTRALVGPSFESGESSLVIRLLTPELGRLGVMLKGARSVRGGGSAGAMQPLAEVEVAAYHREGAELATLRDVAVVKTHEALRTNLDRFALGSFLLDVALEALPPGHAAPELFAFLSGSFDALEAVVESPPLTASGHALLRLLSLLGVEPLIDESLLDGRWRAAAAAPGLPGGSAPTAPPAPDGSARAHSDPAAAAKPRLFLMQVAEGLIVAASGQTGPVAPSSPRSASPPAHRLSPMPTHPEADDYAVAAVLPLPPPAVRAIYDNQRTPDDELPGLPAVSPAHAIALLRAAIALARHHLDIRPRSLRYLEQTLFRRFPLDTARGSE